MSCHRASAPVSGGYVPVFLVKLTMSLWRNVPVLVTILFLTPSITSGDNSCREFPEPGNLQLTVMYGRTISLTVRWENNAALSRFPNYTIVACVDNNPDEKYMQIGMGTAPPLAEFQTLDYVLYMNHSLPISVNFSSGTCTTSSNQAVTFPFIISGQPTVELQGGNATFTVTFATMELPSVTFGVVGTAIVEINVTATQGDADLTREISMFPPDFPNVTTIEVHFTNLTQDTEYNYTVRVLTSSNYFTAVEIPHVVSGTFPMTTPIPGIITHVDVVSISTTSAVVNITYNESIIIGSDSDFNVAVNINPGGITAFQALSPPEQSIHLNGLQMNTEYRGTVQVVSSTGVTVDSFPIIFTTISGGGPSVGAIAGGTIGGAVALWIVISVIGLVVSGVWWLVLKKNGKKASKCHKMIFRFFLILTLVGIPFAICWFKKKPCVYSVQ